MSEKENNNENELTCPISLCRFTHPLVLDCGHSIDKPCFDKLPNKKLCPICNSSNSSYKRINWAIVSFLGLNIEQPPKNPPKTLGRISAQEASQLLISQAKSYAERLIDTEITEKIIQKISNQKRDLEYPVDNTHVRNELVSILQNNLGYKVKYDSTKLTISW